MKGNAKVIAELNAALKEELTAISQYFLHAEMCENWKYEKTPSLYQEAVHRRDEARRALIERILFLDGIPNLTELLHLNVGQNVREQIESDLKLELNAVEMYNNSFIVARRGR